MEAQADLVEIEAFKDQSQSCYDEAVRERDFIDSLIAQVEPQRKYKHLPDHEAHQLSQLEEWREELVFRAENFLASSGHIPHDHLATMRMHPEWNTILLPKVQNLVALINKGANESQLLTHKTVPVIEALPEKIEEPQP